jgi:histidinol phosphatase-like enzyme
MSIARSRAAFLDEHATIVEDVPYHFGPPRFACRREPPPAGLRLVVVSNRSAVAHGYSNEEPLLLMRTAATLDIDLARSSFIGDILNDVETGRRAACRTVLLDNGYKTEWVFSMGHRPHLVARDHDEAARLILAAEATTPAGAGEPALVGGET